MPVVAIQKREFAMKEPKQGHRGETYPGVVSIHEIYTLDEARRRLRWTESSMRSARRRGLKLLACGKRKYVAGQEILRFLQDDSQAQKS